MIIEYKLCTKCGDKNIVKNGKTSTGKQKFHCKSCGYYGTLEPYIRYSEEKKEEILNTYFERSSLRGLHRTYGVAITTILRWLKKKEKG